MSDKKNTNRNMDLLFETGSMRFIPRTWSQFYMKDTANLAEHTHRVLWIAMLLAQRAKADIGKVLQLALIHDLEEIRTGDLNPLTRHYATRDGDKAVADTIAGTDLEPHILALWQELSAKETLEAKLVKDADTLDVDIELMELEFMGHQFRNNFFEERNKLRKLSTDYGRQLWEEIQAGDVTAWYRRGFKLEGK